MTNLRLSVENHDRDTAGLTYVYPVVSRRAGGVSIGINLNPNNACNWRCVYCQVPDLERGKAPPIDLDRLEAELEWMLREVIEGSFLQACVPSEYRSLKDVALSGNGEPTTSTQIGDVIEIIGKQLAAFGRLGAMKTVLITNGSMMNKAFVRDALRTLADLNGQIWFKLDSGTAEGMLRINGVSTTPDQHLERLAAAASLCPTWLQTCVFSWRGSEPSEHEVQAYLDVVRCIQRQGIPVRGVLLYSIARPSLQPEADELAALPRPWLEAFAQRIEAAGLPVEVSG